MSYPRSDYWQSRTPEFRERALTLLVDAERAVAQRERERRERAEREMEQRELHHFETEKAITDALAVLGDENAWDGHARADQLDDTRRILKAAIA